MLDIKYIRENVEKIKENSANRLANVNIDTLLLFSGVMPFHHLLQIKSEITLAPLSIF